MVSYFVIQASALARGDRAGAEAWMTKYDTMPAELTAALASAKAIPVDVEPIFSFKDDVK